jgi:hypothetical protein
MTGRRVGGLDRVDHHVMALAEFVPDSPLEGHGFEIPVPRERGGGLSLHPLIGPLLGSGKPLVLDFAREFLPDDYDEVRHIFSRRGAFRRYKDLLVRRAVLERWYDFSNKSEEAALREWCAQNGIELSGT